MKFLYKSNIMTQNIFLLSSTIKSRLLVFLLVVTSQRQTARMNNNINN